MFKIGDQVKVVEKRLGTYPITSHGSVGVITGISGYHAFVKFSSITSKYRQYVGHTFDILIEDLRYKAEETREERIINKIRVMYSRQQKRSVHV